MHDYTLKWKKFKEMTTWARQGIPQGARVLYKGIIYKLAGNYPFKITLEHNEGWQVNILDSDFQQHDVEDMEFEIKEYNNNAAEVTEKKEESIHDRNSRLEKEFIDFLFSHNQWGK